jgi:type I restriction enzyme S subunit
MSEQQRIADYLDASCAAIDAAVAAKRHQIETLDTLRKSTIHHAVTYGLTPSVKMKPSGVEWFDKIPEHWMVDRLKDVVAAKKDAIKVGPFGSDLLLGDMTENGVKVYNQRTVIDRDFESGNDFISPEKFAGMKAFTVYPNDLLITTRGTIGRCAIVPKISQLGILHPCLMRVQTNKTKLLPEYLALLIQDYALILRQLQMMSAATTIDVIYSDSLKRTYLPLPPVEEQSIIMGFIHEKEYEILSLCSHIESQISTLTAYRKSLIHECVTGQRQVTEADVARAQRGKEAK